MYKRNLFLSLKTPNKEPINIPNKEPTNTILFLLGDAGILNRVASEIVSQVFDLNSLFKITSFLLFSKLARVLSFLIKSLTSPLYFV